MSLLNRLFGVQPPEPDYMKIFGASLNQGEAILAAENDGRKAWRIFVVNEMLAEEFRHPSRKRYRFTPTELAYIAGVPEDAIKFGRNDNECRQSD